MNSILTYKKSMQGYFTLLALVLIVVVGFFGVSAARLFVSSTSSGLNLKSATKAFYWAEAGKQVASRAVAYPVLADRYNCSGTIASDQSTGSFSVAMSASYISSPTVLSAAISFSNTVIPVLSTAGFSQVGRLYIGKEKIDYFGINGSSFINAIRGADGSTAESHSTNEIISQYNCTLVSQGGVPNLTNSAGKQTVRAASEMEYGWTVGKGGSSQHTLGAWNQPPNFNQWLTFSDSGTDGKDLYDIEMINPGDGWAVGEKEGGPLIMHWNGSSWSRFSTSISEDADLLGISCPKANDCWAVGIEYGGEHYILHYNGSSWSYAPSGLSGSDLNAIACPSQNECWAVGKQQLALTAHIIQWTGAIWVDRSALALGVGDLYDISCSGPGTCWAVGEKGEVLMRLVSGVWLPYSLSQASGRKMYGISCPEPGECWAVGEGTAVLPRIYQYTGGSWGVALGNVARNEDLTAISCINKSTCWAVATAGKIVHLENGVWRNVPSSHQGDLNAISMIGAKSKPLSGWQY